MAVRRLDLIITSNATAAIRGFASLEGVAKRAENRFGKAGAALTRFAMVGAVAFGAFAVKSAQAFIDFDDAMTKSLAIMGDISGPMRTRMEDAAKGVARTTTFSATEAAGAYYGLASAGLDAAQSVAALPVVARFAQAGQMELADATDYLVDAQAALGLKSKDASKNMQEMAHVADVLSKANNLATGTLEDFAEALTHKAGSALKTTNKSIEEGVAVLAYLAEQGVHGATAGEQLAIALRDIPRAASRNKAVFREFGISVFDSSGNLKNMADIVAEFEQALGPMNDAQRASTLEQLGMTRSVGDVIRKLIGGSDAIRNFERELSNAGGTTQQVADKQMESLRSKIDVIKNRFNVMMIEFGEPIAIWLVEHFIPWAERELLPVLKDMADQVKDNLAPAFERMGDALGNPMVVRALVALAGFLIAVRGAGAAIAFFSGIWSTLAAIGSGVAAVAGFLTAAGSILTTVGLEIAVVVETMAAAVGLTVGAFAAVALAVVAAIALIVIFRDEIWAFLQRWNLIGVALWLLAAPIAGLVTLFEFFGGFMIRTAQRVGDAFIWLWQKAIQPAWDGITGAAVAAWQAVQPILDAIGRFIRDKVGFPFVWLWQNAVQPAWDGITAAATWAWQSVLQPIFRALSGAVMAVGRFFARLPGYVGTAWSAVGDTVRSVWTDYIQPALGAFIGFLTDTLPQALNWLWQNIIQPVWDGISSAIVSAWHFIHPVLVAVWGFIRRVLGPVFSWLWEEIVQPVWSSIKRHVAGAVVGLKAIMSGIAWVVREVVGPVFNWLWNSVIQPVWNFIRDHIGAIVRALVIIFAPLYLAIKLTGALFRWLWANIVQPVWGFIADKIAWAWHAVIQPVLRGFAWFITNVVAPIFVWLWQSVIQPAWNGITAAAVWAWQTVLLPIFRAIAWFVQNVVAPVFVWIWQNVIQPAWNAIVTATVWAWQTIILPILRAIGWFISNVLGPVFNWLRDFIIAPVWEQVPRIIGWAWTIIRGIWAAMKWVLENVLAPVFRFVLRVVKSVWDAIGRAISLAWNFVIKPIWTAMKWVIDNVIVPAFRFVRDKGIAIWNGLKLGLKAAWDWIKQHVFDRLIGYKDNILDAFRAIRDTAKRIWNQIKETASSIWGKIVSAIRGPVNTAIGIINAIGNGIEWVARKIGLNITIPDIPKLNAAGGKSGGAASRGGAGGRKSTAYGMAAGGVVPFVTDGPRAIVGEGNPMHPEYVIPTDPKYRARALDLFRRLGTQLLAGGGVARPRGPGIAGLYAPLATKVGQLIQRAHGAVSISSGWRSRADQQRLYDAYRAGRGNLAAAPGNSQHEAGNAVDLGGNRSLYTRLAQQLGLVAPVGGEPWHWEHPGQGRSGGGGIMGAGIALTVIDAVKKVRDMAKGIPKLGSKIFGFPKKILTFFKDKVIGWVKGKVQDAIDAALGSAGGIGRAYLEGTGQAANRNLGKRLAAERGWTGAQWDALDRLVQSESNWNHKAQNPTSTAFGIGQFLNGTWSGTGYRKTSDPRTQILAMFKYIAQRYGNPVNAWAFKRSHNWYGMGGVLPSHRNGLYKVPFDDYIARLHKDEQILSKPEADVNRGTGPTRDRVVHINALHIHVDGSGTEEAARRQGREAGKAFLNTLGERRITTDARIS